MKKILISGIITLLFITARGQYSRYVIRFRDKNNSPFSFDNPSAYLSSRAIERRNRFNISLDSTDLPVNPFYLDSIRQAGALTILNVSKWFNQVLIQTTDASALSKIQGFPFVISSQPIADRPLRYSQPEDKLEPEEGEQTYASLQVRNITDNFYNYGTAVGQIHIHDGEYLHNMGFRGEGMIIAILDAGFRNYKTLSAFDSVRLNNQILGTWDFVAGEPGVDEDHPHGMYCFSILASNLPGNLVGTAPKANYYLFRTEDAATEYPVEEQNWAAAAELSDSLGVDLISSSLGYYIFDDPVFNHNYADLDGDKTLITRAADLAAKKGMIVTNSAGNEGNDTWKYIIAPADADSILAVGAVNELGQVASFSSYGPSADGRVKPNLASVGWNTYFVNTNGTVSRGSGTSFSNPNLAGLVTCLWQAFPGFSNMEIIQAVQKSADHYTNPDDRVGYGIPDMRLAFEYLLEERNKREAASILHDDWLKIFPVPFTNQVKVLLKGRLNGKVQLQLIDASGKTIAVESANTQTDQYQFINFSGLDPLPHGTYFVKYSDSKTTRTISVVK